jgi:hypothetical protein
MSRHWHGHAFGQFETLGTFMEGSWVPFTGFGASTLLRTLAMAHVSYGNEDLPPAVAASGIPNLFLRILTIPDGDSPPGSWPTDPDSGTDDVLFAPIIWTNGIAVPAGFTTGSTSNMFYHGALPSGLVDVKSERHFDFGVHGRTHASINGLVSEGEGAGQDVFSAQITIRQLWEHP